jgi:O-antigen ligase
MAWRPRLDLSVVPSALVVAAAAIYASVIPVVVFGMSKLYSVPLVVGTVFPIVLYASRNPRLFFLVGMIFTSQLGLSINFRGAPHMGGAHAFSISLMDFFLVPLLVFLARDYYRGVRREFVLSPVSAWWLALVALGAYSVVVGPFREMALKETVSMVKNWILFLVIVNECVRERHFHYAVMAIAASVATNVCVAFLQFLLKRDLGLQALGEASPESTAGANFGVYGSLDGVYRVGGLAGHANLLSAYLAMVLPILIGQMYTNYRWPAKTLLALLAAAGAAALGMTLSRSGWVAFAVSLSLLMLALVALPGIRMRHVALKVSMVAAMAGAAVAGSGPVLRRFLQSDSGAVDFRLEWVKIAWEMVQDKPILGFGLNSFVYHLEHYAPYSPARMYELFGDMLPAVHNTYMLVWSEQGTVGLFLFLGMHAQLFWIAIKMLRYGGLSERVSMVGIAGACGVLAIMIDGISSFYLRIHAPARTFWVVAGLVVAAYYWHVRNHELRRQLAQPRGA